MKPKSTCFSELKHCTLILSLALALFSVESAVANPVNSDARLIAQAWKRKDLSKPEQPNVKRFEWAIKMFEFGDRRKPPPPGCTVFVGSSTVRFWKSAEDDFREFKAINRGFGGSTFPDVNNYVDRIVTNYNPSRVVVYAGTNDIADLHHTGEDIFHDFEEFVHRVRAKAPKAEIYFISMSMAPSRVQYVDVYDKGNALIRQFIQKNKHLHYIDVLPVMRDDAGQLRTELFGPDRLHMNSEGYAQWKPVVMKALKQTTP